MKLITSTVALALGLAILPYFGSCGWSHYRQDAWAEDYPACGESAQSPINIVTADTVRDADLKLFEFTGDWSMALPATSVGNTGHDYIVYVNDFDLTNAPKTPINPYGVDLEMEGGGLPGAPYELYQFHFHQGSSANFAGSEHFLDGKQYPAEVHFVFVSKSGTQSTSQVGFLAVLGFFIDVLDDTYGDNTGSLDTFFDSIEMTRGSQEFRFVNDSIRLDTIIPLHNMDKMNRFYRYDGSLTTPACGQVVAWTVFEDPLYISRSQYLKFMGGTDVDGAELKNNFRYLQDLNGRTVYRSALAGVHDDDVDSSFAISGSFALLLTTALSAVLFSQS